MPETHGEIGDSLCLEKTKEEKQQEDRNKLAPLLDTGVCVINMVTLRLALTLRFTLLLLYWSGCAGWPSQAQQFSLQALRQAAQTRQNLSESAESKVERLGQVFRKNVRLLRERGGCLDLVFLVDESSSVGASNFGSELRFVRKLLSDFPVAPEATRVALVTFSSKSHVVTRADYVSAPKAHQHKCSLFSKEIPSITYRGGGTYTRGAFQRAAVSAAV